MLIIVQSGQRDFFYPYIGQFTPAKGADERNERHFLQVTTAGLTPCG